MSIPQHIQIRGDSSRNWGTHDPTLTLNEVGLETNTGRFKVGDGATAWNDLSYFCELGPQPLRAYDTTTELPSAAAYARCMAWATDISKPCYCDGTTWYTVDGTAL